MNISKRLKEIRTLKNVTQKQAARVLGVDERTYRRYELGELDLSTANLTALCQYFDVSSDYLLGLSDDINSEKR